jgi:dUTP pyrophosphatase
MFNKIKEMKKMLEDFKNLQDNPEKINDDIFESLGINREEFEKKLNVAFQHKVDLKFTKINEDAITPKYNYESDSGFDLHAIEDVLVEPLGRVLVPTGLKFDIPKGFEIQVRPKSGLALKEGLTVLNTPGTVDEGYDGEVKVIIYNVNGKSYQIKKGQKIAQAVLCPVRAGRSVNLREVIELTQKERGNNGFGSTGI